MLLDQTQGTEMERLWNLLGELSSQLSHNRQQTEELHRRADELRSQAVHSQTGFTLRRFNVDVSKEEFESELERLNVSLVMENQSLQQENRQLSSLLKDYESTLDAVMSKFRSYAHASQHHDLELTRHYESLLLSLPVSVPPPPPPRPAATAELSDLAAPVPIDPANLQASLSHLASLIRKAMRSLQGEDPEDSTSPLLHPVAESSLFESLSFFSSASASSSSSTSSRSRSSSVSSSTSSSVEVERGENDDNDDNDDEVARALLLASHHPVTARQPRLSDPSQGGYIGRHATTNALYEPTTSTSSLVQSPPRPGAGPPPNASASADGAGASVAPPPNPRSNSSFSSSPPDRTGSTSAAAGQAARAIRKKRDLESESRRRQDELDRVERFRQRGLGPLDEALMREVEVEALRRENDELKKLLGIDDEERDDDDVDDHDHDQEDVFGRERQGQDVGEVGEGRDGERGQGGARRGTRGLLFESGAKPERIEGEDEDDEPHDDDEEDDGEGDGDEAGQDREDEEDDDSDDDDKEPELSEADSELLAELFDDDSNSAPSPLPTIETTSDRKSEGDLAAQLGAPPVVKENEENTGEGIVSAAPVVAGRESKEDQGTRPVEGSEAGERTGESEESVTSEAIEPKPSYLPTRGVFFPGPLPTQ